MWTIASIILLIAGIAAMVWYHSANGEEPDPEVPARDPLVNAQPTPSMRATRKYFFVVIGLLLAQIGLGAITAHYAVEGQAFFGIPLAEVLPYTASRTIQAPTSRPSSVSCTPFSGRSTSCTNAMGAVSPARKPNFRIRR